MILNAGNLKIENYEDFETTVISKNLFMTILKKYDSYFKINFEIEC